MLPRTTKVVARALNGSSTDSARYGYDVVRWRSGLDADGNELFPHNGLLVADRSFSSTQDYGLDVDATGEVIARLHSATPAIIDRALEAARAALRIGAGLVTLAAPAPAMGECAAQLTAVMLRRCRQAGPVSCTVTAPT